MIRHNCTKCVTGQLSQQASPYISPRLPSLFQGTFFAQGSIECLKSSENLGEMNWLEKSSSLMLKFQADRSQVLDRLPLPPISRHLPARYQYFNSRKCYFCHLSHARPDYWRNLVGFCRSFTSFIQSDFGWRGSFWQGAIRRYLPFPISVNGGGGGRLDLSADLSARVIY